MQSFSSWDRKKAAKRRSPAFSLGTPRVLFEFENRRRERIFNSKSGAIISSTSSIESSRNRVIEENLANGRFHSVSHTHISPVVLDEEGTVLAHGAKVSDGSENCSVIGAECTDGTDSQCARGKCAIGRLSRVENRQSLWRYDSLTVPGLYYFVQGEVSVKLKSVNRGLFRLPAGAGSISVNRLASLAATIYLPLPETFTRSVIKSMGLDGQVRSLFDTCDVFVREALRTETGSEELNDIVRGRVDFSLKSELPTVWYEVVSSDINAYVGDNPFLTNRDFLVGVYNLLSGYQGKIVQDMRNGVRSGLFTPNTDIGRPIYSRLPGISGAYNSEDNPDNPSKWLVAGADETLSYSKTLLDRFYETFLSPGTAYPVCLDWIAQHMGFSGSMWDLDWSTNVKRLLLANAHTRSIPSGTGLWVTNPAQDTLLRVDRSRIEAVTIDEETGEVETSYYLTQKTYNSTTSLTSLSPLPTLLIDLSEWPGLIPSRGSLTSLLFLFWVFGIKAVSGEELVHDGTSYRVKSGLRTSEQTAPINIPYGTDVLHVGSNVDALVGNFPNQLIADVGVCYDEEISNTTVIRLPFYYNRNGRTWDTVKVLVENWMPATTQTRIQYGYAAAGLLVADDIFFEPVPV